MNKLEWPDVTDVPCTCGALARYAAKPKLPIIFDEKMNEYQIDHTAPDGTRILMQIYHCFFCGGVASKSRRAEMSALVSRDEFERLSSLIGEIAKPEEIEPILGPPEHNEILIPSQSHFESAYFADAEQYVRRLTYTNLSATAIVLFLVTSNGKVRIQISRRPSEGSGGMPSSHDA